MIDLAVQLREGNFDAIPYAQKMKETPQNPKWHDEGDVFTHTVMVCRALQNSAGYKALDERRQDELLCAAALHDIGKTVCTVLQDGQWTSPHHAQRGAEMARTLLWQAYNLCGTKQKQNERETVCFLIRYHDTALHLLSAADAERKVRKIASIGANIPDFTMEMLLLLAQADISGRIADDTDDLLENTELIKELCREAGCLSAPYPFPDDNTLYNYLSGKDILPYQPFYNTTKSHVIMLCGLPGTGKDTYIAREYPGVPVISLDDLREELGIAPTDDQMKVVAAAKEQAKQYLRAGQHFIWNATNLSLRIRQGLCRLFSDYNASISIVYLETDLQTELARNKNRNRSVPEDAIAKMLARLNPPERFEAHSVQWLCV